MKTIFICITNVVRKSVAKYFYKNEIVFYLFNLVYTLQIGMVMLKNTHHWERAFRRSNNFRLLWMHFSKSVIMSPWLSNIVPKHKPRDKTEIIECGYGVTFKNVINKKMCRRHWANCQSQFARRTQCDQIYKNYWANFFQFT